MTPVTGSSIPGAVPGAPRARGSSDQRDPALNALLTAYGSLAPSTDGMVLRSDSTNPLGFSWVQQGGVPALANVGFSLFEGTGLVPQWQPGPGAYAVMLRNTIAQAVASGGSDISLGWDTEVYKSPLGPNLHTGASPTTINAVSQGISLVVFRPIFADTVGWTADLWANIKDGLGNTLAQQIFRSSNIDASGRIRLPTLTALWFHNVGDTVSAIINNTSGSTAINASGGVSGCTFGAVNLTRDLNF